jgi:diguanylate cyclase (GGDEF)-like protein/PAS domain S-box-containing protein
MKQQPLVCRSWKHYVAAIALVALAAALRIWPLQALGSHLAWVTFYPVVMVAAIYGGLYAGLLATVLSCLVVTFFWSWIGASPFIVDFAHWLGVSIFILSGCLVSVVAEAMHRAQIRALNAQKQADEANQSRLLLENSPIGMIAIDANNGRVVQANLIAQNMWGYTTEEFLTKTITDLTYPEDRAETLQRSEQLSKGLVDYLHFEKRYLKKDGSHFWAEVYVSSLKDAEDKVTRFIGSTIDLTERKHAEESKREIEDRYRSLFENMLEGYAFCKMLYEHDIPQDFIYLDVNDKFMELTGLKDVAGKRVSEVIPGIRESNPELFEVYGRVAQSGKPERLETYVDGLGIWFSIAIYSPRSEHFVAVFDNITERKKAEDELRIAAITFESHEGMTVTDANNAILKVNPTFTMITGYTAEEVIGKNPSILSSGKQNASFYEAMWKSVNDTGAWEGDIFDRRKNGEIYPAHLTITAVKNKSGIVTNYVGTFSDSSEIQAAVGEIKHLAFYDYLTGLPNRRLLVDRLQQAMSSSVRSGKEGALLFIDLDDFKSLNDTIGHDMGDLLLQQVAQRLGSCVRDGDTVARIGGDEFVVMLEDLSEQALEAAAETEDIGEKILAALNQPYLLATHISHSTSSIGATLFIDHKRRIDDLFKQAELAMYQAKKVGRNTLRFFDPQMQESINARSILESELRKAIENQQFQLYYQIQVDQSLRPFGAEALIRWIHPERGLVSPALFIPLAEETGLIFPIGWWVLETACAQLKTWQKDAFTCGLILSVNVSAKQFHQADFVDQVQAAVQHYGINPTLLKLELTESMLLESIEDTIATMKALKNIGIRFSLDDFGTGYSSLQYLKRLPLDQLKIDQSFVHDITTDSSDRAIVRTVIAMALSLNLDIIAEGVETEEQRQFLLDNDCTNYQGYLFSKPVPIEQFDVLLKGR